MLKTVLITGCSSGIGLSAAKLFQSKGWNVVATMRKPQSDAGEQLSKLPNTLVMRLDVRDSQSIKFAVDSTLEKFKRIDLLVNNAGYGQAGLLEGVSREKIQEQFDVNVFGVIETIQRVLPHMRNNEESNGRRGVILNVGSGAGVFALPATSLYCASKHALDGLTENISYELASQGISTKLVIPHSGVASTNFNESSAASLAGAPSLSSYDDFIKAVFGRYGSMISDISLSPDAVAHLIYEAATDESNRLRYYIGEDPLDILGKKQQLSEEDFMEFVRSKFT